MEVGIEPTVRHGADLGYIPVVVTDACGAGHQDAAERSLASLRFTGDAVDDEQRALRVADTVGGEPLNAHRSRAHRNDLA